MNIAILIQELGGGGAERAASKLGNYYSERGHNVYYFLGDYHVRKRYQVTGKIVNTGVRSILDLKGTEVLKVFESANRIRKLKRKYKIDVAVSFMEEFNYLNVLSRRNERVIVSVRTVLSKRKELENYSLLKPSVLGVIYNKADWGVVQTEYALRDMKDVYRIKEKKMCIIPNSCNCRELPSIHCDHADEPLKTIICVGRLHDVKQYNVAVKAFYIVHEKMKNVRLCILGEGEDKRKIEAMIEHGGLSEYIHLLKYQEDVTSFLRTSTVFLMTSKVEGFPNSMVEAMAEGLPVVATYSPGGIPEILGEIEEGCHAKYGILTPYALDDNYNIKKITKEEKMLGEALTELLMSEELLTKYRKRSLQRARSYDIGKVMKKWDKVIFGTSAKTRQR